MWTNKNVAAWISLTVAGLGCASVLSQPQADVESTHASLLLCLLAGAITWFACQVTHSIEDYLTAKQAAEHDPKAGL